MSTQKKTPGKRTVAATSSTAKYPSKKTSWYRLRRWWHNTNKRRKAYLQRRPHRSFVLTRRRDYQRSLRLPGYFALTTAFLRLLKKHWKMFACLGVVYAIMALLLSSAISQDTYQQLSDITNSAREEGLMGGTVATLSIFWGVFVNQLGGASADTSVRVAGVLLGLFMWLATVWLLRSVMAGKQPKTRDGIYGSGGPVIALLVLVVVLIVQMLPATIGIITYGAADGSGLLKNTAMLMLFGGAAILLTVMSLYWMTSTFFAMVIVSLPGMYPMRAIKLAGDIVLGRRIRILLRLLWLVVLLLLLWFVTLVPVILLDGALKSSIPALGWLPLVPLVALLLMAISIIFAAGYIYFFYRKVVDDDAAPA